MIPFPSDFRTSLSCLVTKISTLIPLEFHPLLSFHSPFICTTPSTPLQLDNIPCKTPFFLPFYNSNFFPCLITYFFFFNCLLINTRIYISIFLSGHLFLLLLFTLSRCYGYPSWRPPGSLAYYIHLLPCGLFVHDLKFLVRSAIITYCMKRLLDRMVTFLEPPFYD